MFDEPILLVETSGETTFDLSNLDGTVTSANTHLEMHCWHYGKFATIFGQLDISELETSSLWYGFSESAGFVNLARLFRNLEHSSSNCELLIYDVDMYDVDMYVHDKPEIKSVKVKKKLSCILISSSLR